MTPSSKILLLLCTLSILGLLAACGNSDSQSPSSDDHTHPPGEEHDHSQDEDGEHGHSHDESGQDEHDHSHDESGQGEHGHSHDEHSHDEHSHDEHSLDEHNHDHAEEAHSHDEHGHSHDDSEGGHSQEASGPHNQDDHEHEDHGHDDHGHDDHEHEDHGHDDHEHGDHEHDDHEHGNPKAWVLTAFGGAFEIFAEADPLRAAHESKAHTHVTILEGFQPFHRGSVAVVLSAPGQEDQVFRQERALRPGVFDISVEPRSPGVFQLAFRVRGQGLEETIPAGQVRVGRGEEDGEVLAPTFFPSGSEGEAVEFLKEQQWQTAFATQWVATGNLSDSVRGPATVRPPAGGEVVLTSPVAGVLARTSAPWPFAGAQVDRGVPLFTVVPRRTDATTTATLSARITGLGAELETHRSRLARLEELLAVEAVSRREVEELRAKIIALEAELQSQRKDLKTEEAARGSGSAPSGGVMVRAPFDAGVASVPVSPGETVAAGTELARLLARGSLWIEVRLAPDDAARFTAAASADEGQSPGLVLRTAGSQESVTLGGKTLRFVAQHPEVDRTTGTVAVIFEVDSPPSALLPGIRAEAEVLLPTARPGLVVPKSALVDDSGVDVVYVQQDGESFRRTEVRVLARQGERLLVSGLEVGERLVTQGGNSIRRTALLASGGGGHGHVH